MRRYMPSDREKDWLEDILEAIQMIEKFVTGMEFADFQDDPKTRYAVFHALLIISEASRRLSEDLKSRHPDIPWRDIANSGNIYRHKYHSINDRMIWKTVTESWPTLKNALMKKLEEMDCNAWIRVNLAHRQTASHQHA